MKEYNPIKILLKHYMQAKVTVEVTLFDPYTLKEEKFEASGIIIEHIEDPNLKIFAN